MKEKTKRNQEIYKKYRAGLLRYAKTASPKDKMSYKQLADEYDLSKTTVITICQRELNREK